MCPKLCSAKLGVGWTIKKKSKPYAHPFQCHMEHHPSWNTSQLTEISVLGCFCVKRVTVENTQLEIFSRYIHYFMMVRYQIFCEILETECVNKAYSGGRTGL